MGGVRGVGGQGAGPGKRESNDRYSQISYYAKNIGLHMGKKTKCDTATSKVVQIRPGSLYIKNVESDVKVL